MRVCDCDGWRLRKKKISDKIFYDICKVVKIELTLEDTDIHTPVFLQLKLFAFADRCHAHYLQCH